MKQLKRSFIALLFIVCLAPLTVQANDTLQVGSTARNMIVYAPAQLPKNSPLIISMHGMNQDAPYQQSKALWEPIADTAKFVVVYPNGISKRWDISGSTDLDFILAIIDNMYQRFGIDRSRVYLSGFSMGGMMTYYAATKIADKIAAFAPVSGYSLRGSTTPSSSRPVPIIHVHGDADDVVNYPNLAAFLNGWVARNGCVSTPVITKPYPSNKPSSSATKSYWAAGPNGVEVTLLTLSGKGHWYSMDEANGINTSNEIWNFVKKYALPKVK